MRNPPPLMLEYIKWRVGIKAAMFEDQTLRQSELSQRQRQPLMLNYIRQNVGTRSAMVEAQTTYQYELSKSEELVAIENQYRQDKTEKMKTIKKVNLERETSQYSWIL
jgi:hypothetical protein